MPPTTVRNLELAIHDLKHSNYFRVWFLTFIAVFVVFWVGFGIYVNHVDNSSNLFATGFTPNWAIEFPLFHFRLEGMQNASLAINVDSINCIWNQTVPLQVVPCQGYPAFQNGLANCFAVETHNKSFAAWATMDASGRPDFFLDIQEYPDLFQSPNRGPSRIYCNFTVNPTALGATPNWVAWDLEGLTNYQYGDNAYGALWFPNDNVQWILLEQFLIDGTTYWDRNRLSHLPATPATDANNNTLYQTATIVDTTTVQFYEQFGLGYHSWNGLADIGGLAFALYIMQTVVMMFAGLFLENDSVFLGGKEPARDSERQAIVQN